jgi:hypothetical protein
MRRVAPATSLPPSPATAATVSASQHAHPERRHVVARRAHSRVAGALTDCFASRERRHHLCESCRRQSDSHKLATAAFFEVPLS